MHGYNLAKHTRGHTQVDVLTVGAPMWGDKNMIEAAARLVNQRNIVYVGDGAGGKFFLWMCLCMNVCVCVWKRERENRDCGRCAEEEGRTERNMGRRQKKYFSSFSTRFPWDYFVCMSIVALLCVCMREEEND